MRRGFQEKEKEKIWLTKRSQHSVKRALLSDCQDVEQNRTKRRSCKGGEIRSTNFRDRRVLEDEEKVLMPCGELVLVLKRETLTLLADPVGRSGSY